VPKSTPTRSNQTRHVKEGNKDSDRVNSSPAVLKNMEHSRHRPGFDPRHQNRRDKKKKIKHGPLAFMVLFEAQFQLA
jgi:hypothetical protein